jgi:hypothetical protein
MEKDLLSIDGKGAVADVTRMRAVAVGELGTIHRILSDGSSVAIGSHVCPSLVLYETL